MKKTALTIGALAAAMFVATAAPSMAARGGDWERLGSVSFQPRLDSESALGRFDGRVDRIRLEARNYDVRCRSVRVRFDNGHVRDIFNGVLRAGQERTIDLPGNERGIRRINFLCRSLGNRAATVTISGRVDDRHGGGWNPGRDWRLLSSENFDWRGDRESAFTRFSGDVERLGFVAQNGDAQCRFIRIKYRNGRTQNVRLGAGGRMIEDELYRVDLRGDERRVARVDMFCRATDRRNVTIGIYGRN